MGSFLDALVQRKYNLADEIIAIEKLFHNQEYGISLCSTFSSIFLRWPHRNNYVSAKDFFDGMGIQDIIYSSKAKEDIPIELFVFYAECILNILIYVKYANHSEYIKYITQNINNVLESFNFQMNVDKKGQIHIILKDVLVTESAEILQDTYDLGENVYAYNYREMSGDLHRKGDILCRLYKYFETIKKQAIGFGFSTMVEDISDLSNKLDVRHAPTKKQEIVLGGMTKEEIEQWYDELFRMYLSLVVLVDYKNRRKDIKELKSKLG